MNSYSTWIRAVALLVASVSYGHVARAANGMRVEGVGDYSACGGNQIDLRREAQVMYDALNTTANSPWLNGSNDFWPDSDAWDTDWYDRDRTLNLADFDGYLDNSLIGLSAFFGHGNCNDATAVPCTSDSDCAPNGYCPVFEPLNPGYSRACINNISHIMWTCSPNYDQHSHQVLYGNGYNNIALGESPGNTWAGAGNDGGTNVAVIFNSCGARTKFITSQLQSMFAGMHMLMITMPTAAYTDGAGNRGYSDLTEEYFRGDYFSNYILANPNAVAADAFLDVPLSGDDAWGQAGVNGLSHADGIHGVVAFDTTYPRFRALPTSRRLIECVGAKARLAERRGLAEAIFA